MRITRRGFTAGTIAAATMTAAAHPAHGQSPPRIRLGRPRRSGTLSVEQAIEQRRSIRTFRNPALSLEQLSQLLWSAQGITGPNDRRAAPSAGALYPLELSVVSKDIEALVSGAYRYHPQSHTLLPIARGRLEARLAEASRRQLWMAGAPAVICIAAVFTRTSAKYGSRGLGYAHIEAGAAAENLLLQAVALGLGATLVGSFDAPQVKRLLHLAPDETPLCLIPVGTP